MSVWDAYPQEYRSQEIRAILTAVQAGECVSVIGLSGAGKSNLVGFLANRVSAGSPTFVLVDGNRAQPRSAEGLFALAAQSLDADAGAQVPLERAVQRRLQAGPGGLCLVFDRYDALPEAERARAAGPLRALRDAHKYQLTYVIATRRPLEANDELAELFYANTLWLGPLAPADAHWSAQQYARRRGQAWEDALLDKLIEVSWGYPSLLRACCEAAAALLQDGVGLAPETFRAHPAVQRRVQEFWADAPSPEDLRRSGLKGHPLLNAAAPPVTAESPDLTASEHRLLAYLQAHAGDVTAKDDLIRAVWPEDRVVAGLRDDSLAQLIRRLRQKIGAERIQTIPGRGYRYVE